MPSAVEILRIEYQPTVADFMSAYKLQMSRSLSMRAISIVNPLMGVFLMLIAALPPLAHTGHWRSAIVPFTLGLIVAFWSKLFLRLRYSRDPRLGQRFTTMFTSEGFTVAGETSRSEYLWKGVTDVRENKQVLLIGFGPSQTDIMPKRAFSGEQLQHFRQLAASHCRHVKL